MGEHGEVCEAQVMQRKKQAIQTTLFPGAAIARVHKADTRTGKPEVGFPTCAMHRDHTLQS